MADDSLAELGKNDKKFSKKGKGRKNVRKKPKQDGNVGNVQPQLNAGAAGDIKSGTNIRSEEKKQPPKVNEIFSYHFSPTFHVFHNNIRTKSVLLSDTTRQVPDKQSCFF